MRLEEVLDQPGAAWLAMERYVNDGSPSGITTTTSDRTSPAGPFTHFELPFYSCPELTLPSAGLRVPDPGLPSAAFPVHPDLEPSTEGGLPGGRAVTAVDRVRVTPTSSGRTVAVIDDRFGAVHLKLHYPRVLGRFARRIDAPRALAALDTTALLADPRADLPADVAFLPEASALVTPDGTAAILRSPTPYPVARDRALVPLFSLFSRDRRRPHDPTLLRQIIDRDPDAPATVWTRLLRPIVDAWAHLALRLGLLPEWNAQNLLIELDIDGQIARLVFRDLEGQHRDLARRPYWSTSLSPGDRRVLADNDDAARQQRSWLYDFKLGDYVLDPLITAASPKATTRQQLIDAVRARFDQQLDAAGLGAADLFPLDGHTYAQPPGLVKDRRWIEPRETPPLYRSRWG